MAHVNVLMHGSDTSIQIPGKTFELLATGNEMIALTTEGATYNLLRRFNHILFAELDNKEKIKECIKIAIKRVRYDTPKKHIINKDIENLSRRKLTGTLSELLNEILNKH